MIQQLLQPFCLAFLTAILFLSSAGYTNELTEILNNNINRDLSKLSKEDYDKIMAEINKFAPAELRTKLESKDFKTWFIWKNLTDENKFIVLQESRTVFNFGLLPRFTEIEHNFLFLDAQGNLEKCTKKIFPAGLMPASVVQLIRNGNYEFIFDCQRETLNSILGKYVIFTFADNKVLQTNILDTDGKTVSKIGSLIETPEPSPPFIR